MVNIKYTANISKIVFPSFFKIVVQKFFFLRRNRLTRFPVEIKSLPRGKSFDPIEERATQKATVLSERNRRGSVIVAGTLSKKN